jgi:predicted secreted hydrolase
MLYPKVNQGLMTENVKTPRLGVVPQVDLEKDLPRKPDYSVDSFFVIGRVEQGGHKLNYLFHIMAMTMPIPIPKIAKKWQVAFSVMDENTGFYTSGDHIYTDDQVEVGADTFSIKAPSCEMSGNWDKMRIWLKEKDFEIDTYTSAIHYPIFTRGSAVFDLFGMVVHQFSVPFMKTTGTFTVEGHTYNLNGDNAVSWFDRQWQKQNFKITTEWSWMAIYLDNGDVISILDSVGETDTPRFMSVLHPDGTLEHATDAQSFAKSETRKWTSEVSGQEYGTRWDLVLPSFDAKLHIEPVIEKQEIMSGMKKLAKYEGSANVKGIYLGQEVTGRATVELIKI